MEEALREYSEQLEEMVEERTKELRDAQMKLLDIVRRQPIPAPWTEGEKIPWDDPDFSRRMLREHLSQAHDAASRRFETIDRHVDWIHHKLLQGNPTRILDLGCGPGLYTSRLARLGHECVGIDFSPASIAYAREQAEKEGLRCRYVQEDIRTADYAPTQFGGQTSSGAEYGLAMFIFGEFNVFRPTDARLILEKVYRALAANGLLLLEPHTFSAVRKAGELHAFWYSAVSGLFSDRPHLILCESFWDADRSITTERYFILDALTGDVTRHAQSMQGYTDEQYESLLNECGFGEVRFHPSLTGDIDESQSDFIVIVSRKQ